MGNKSEVICRTLLNIGLLGVVTALFDGCIIFGELSARYTHAGMDNGSIPEVLIMLIVSLVMVAVFSKGFRGYGRFLRVYRLPVLVTVIVQAVTWVFSLIYLTSVKNRDYSGNIMPGFAALGDHVLMWMIWAVIVLALVIMWIVVFVKRHEIQKKYALKHGYKCD